MESKQQRKELQAICNCLLKNRPFIESAYDILAALSELRKPSEASVSNFKESMQKRDRDFRESQKNGVKHSLELIGSEPSEPIGQTDEEMVQKLLNIMDENSDCDETDSLYLIGGQYESVAKEIAKLLSSSRSQENDVNKKLLLFCYDAGKWGGFRDAETLTEKFKKANPNETVYEKSGDVNVNVELLEAATDALNMFYGIGCTDEAEIVQELKIAISNAEKQINHEIHK